MNLFLNVIEHNNINIKKESVTSVKEQWVIWFANALKEYSPSTEQCYLTALIGFYEFLAAEELAAILLPKVRLLIKQRARRPGIRLPQFPREEIEAMISYAQTLDVMITNKKEDRLINFRDKALIFTLADTGLRIHELCQMRRGDIDWNEGRAAIIGKGDKQAIIRFSTRSMQAIKDYLSLRAEADGSSGKPLQALPIFARHDKATGKAIKPISTTTGRKIIAERVKQCLGAESVGKITPHSFRHYFVTSILIASGNLKLAQELARHKNISVTQRYSHLADDELDREYYQIFG
jgi:integrase